MTARISKDFHFLNNLYFNNKHYVNSYDINCSFTVATESILEQNIAMERLRYFLFEFLEHSVFINQNNTEQIEKYRNCGLTVCTLPEEPYDQIVGIMLFVKFNAIMEGRLVLTDIIIESAMSDGVNCLHNEEENIGPFLLKDWWNESSCRINNLTTKNKKVVKLTKHKSDWESANLDYVPDSVYETMLTDEVKIIFPNFDKKDK